MEQYIYVSPKSSEVDSHPAAAFYIDSEKGIAYRDLKVPHELIDDADINGSYTLFRENILNRLDFLRLPIWGLWHMIPETEVQIKDDEYRGKICRITLEVKKAVPLTDITNNSHSESEQLAMFLSGSRKMALTQDRLNGKRIIPDLLGGIRHPADSFHNFVVDNSSQLWYVPGFHLPEFGKSPFSYFTRMNYAHQLMKAAGKFTHPAIHEQTDKLISEAIL